MTDELPPFNTDESWLAYCASLEPVLEKMAQKYCGSDSGMMDDAIQEARIAIYGIFPEQINGERGKYVRNVARNAMLSWLDSYKTGPLDTGRTVYVQRKGQPSYKVHKPPRYASYDHLSDAFGFDITDNHEVTWNARDDGLELEPAEQQREPLPEALTEHDYRDTPTNGPERRWTVHYGWRTRLKDKAVALRLQVRKWTSAQKKKLAKLKKKRAKPITKKAAKPKKPAATKPKPVAPKPEVTKAVAPKAQPVSQPKVAKAPQPAAKRKRGPTPKPFEEVECGTRAKFNKGCRCEACREVERRRDRERYARKREREGKSTMPRKKRPVAEHGTLAMYVHHACRCDACKAVKSEATRKSYEKRKAKMAEGMRPNIRGPEPDHGTTKRYFALGCRCDQCREAVNAYNREKYAKRKQKQNAA